VRSIGGAIEPYAVIGADHAIFTGDRVPLLSIVGLLDQRIGKIAKLPLIVGQSEIRRRCVLSGNGVVVEPVMDIVAHQLRANFTQVAVGASG
jgi:hypothetical protein